MRRIEVFSDAACDNNSKLKLMGLGVAVFLDGERAEQYDVCLFGGTNGTNNVGEYLAFLEALKKIKELNTLFKENCTFLLCSDSQVVVNQFKGVWDCNYPHLEDLMLECRALRREMNIPSSRLRIQWVSRKLNKEADKLSKDAIKNFIAENIET